jgi:hypothetical protein
MMDHRPASRSRSSAAWTWSIESTLNDRWWSLAVGRRAALTLTPEREHQGATLTEEDVLPPDLGRLSHHLEAEHLLVEPGGAPEVADIEPDVSRGEPRRRRGHAASQDGKWMLHHQTSI